MALGKLKNWEISSQSNQIRLFWKWVEYLLNKCNGWLSGFDLTGYVWLLHVISFELGVGGVDELYCRRNK